MIRLSIFSEDSVIFNNRPDECRDESPAVSLSHVYSRRTRYRATPSYLRVASVSRMSQEVSSLASRTRLSSGSTSLACAACASRTRIRQLSLACLSAGLRVGLNASLSWLAAPERTRLSRACLCACLSCESHADNWLRLSNASLRPFVFRVERLSNVFHSMSDVVWVVCLSPVPSRRVDHASLSRSHPFRAIALVSLASRTRYPLVRHRTIVRASHRTIELTSPVSRGSRR